jgi:HlyD family secretion protein
MTSSLSGPSSQEGITRQRRSGLRWLVLALLLAGLTGGAAWAYFNILHPGPKTLGMSITPVTAQTIEITVNESGTVELAGQQSLKSPGEVAVDRVLVTVGDRVQKGQQLIVLRSKQQQNNLAEQQLQIRKQDLALARNRQKVQEARDRLMRLERDNFAQRKQQLELRKQAIVIERSQQKIREAEAKVEAEAKQLSNTEILAEKGFISGDELEQKRESLRSAQANLKETELDARTQGLEWEKVRLDQQTQSEQEEKLQVAKTVLLDAQSEVISGEQELERLRLEQANRVAESRNNLISAPISGKVLDVRVKDGDGINTGGILLTIGNPEQELVKLQLGTLDAAQVKLDQKARIKVIGPEAKSYEGLVIAINPQAVSGTDGAGQGGSSGGQSRVPAVVRLDRPSGKLIPGSQVSVEIVTQQRQKVLAVTIEEIQRSEAMPFVWVQDRQRRAKKQSVKLGLEGVTQVEIIQGLKLGDRVISVPTDAPIEVGMIIKEEEPGSRPSMSPN